MRWAVAALFLALVSGVGAIWWRAAQSSTAVSPAQALEAFRESPSTAPVPTAPKPGVYEYRATGSERGGVGSLTIGRKLPGTTRLVVTHVSGGWEATFFFSEEHVEASRYIPQADGALTVTWHRTKVTFAGIGRDDKRDVTPPSLVLPADAAPGKSWRERYRTGDINVDTESRIVGAEQVRVGNTPVDTLLIETHSTTDGPHPGTRDEKLWWAPTLGLPARWDVAMDIGGTFGFTGRSSIRLASPVPVT